MSENIDSSDPEVFLFPLTNEKGFRVIDQGSYAHLMNFIIYVATELEEEYPHKTIWVTYRI